MNRKKFLKNSLLGLITIPTIMTSCQEKVIDPNTCAISPDATAGPFPIKTPADWIRANIVGNRAGVPLVITIKIENTNKNCEPLSGVLVDIWHCDAHGNYSEYSGQLDGDFTSDHFLRGRQTTDANGVVSFISIYPGWYPGRAPHLHLEIKDNAGKSLLITQTAFPEDISKTVYNSNGYKGVHDTTNQEDGIFGSGLNRSIANSVTGNITDGYTLTEVIKVAG